MIFNFLTTTGDAGAMAGTWTWIVMLALMFVVMYFMVIRPQKKQQKKLDELVASIGVGDSVLTTSGFYGVVIDIASDDVVIVEFGNNKNCRIPMKKTNIVEVEKGNN